MEEVAGEAPAERLEMSGGNIQHTVIEYGIWSDAWDRNSGEGTVSSVDRHSGKPGRVDADKNQKNFSRPRWVMTLKRFQRWKHTT